jgi:hypothetical protein
MIMLDPYSQFVIGDVLPMVEAKAFQRLADVHQLWK